VRRPFQRQGKAIIASLLAGLVLLLDALAASPQLHELIHQDAGSAEHQCAVTLFAHGQVDAAAVEVAASVPDCPVEFLPPVSAAIFQSLVATLPPGRGPPVRLLPA